MVILWGAKFFLCPFFVDVFLKCFADVFFEMLCCGVGYQDSLRASCAAPAGLTENKESVFH